LPRVFRVLLPCILVLSYLAFSCASADACTTPVYQYALQHWPVDPYDVFIFHRGLLSTQDQDLVDSLRRPESPDNFNSNYRLHSVDPAKNTNEAIQHLWEIQTNPIMPWMVVCYPMTADESAIAWAGRFNKQTAESLVNSALRRQITDCILAGDVAVWILLESGRRDKDERVADLLKTELNRLSKTLSPDRPLAYAGSDLNTPPNDSAVTKSFSFLRLSRTNPDEQILINMLLNSEPDLRSLAEPMAFPIFGRGRILYALVGRGINKENILEACTFLTGACACDIKVNNPGTDLLTGVDWPAALAKQSNLESSPPSIIHMRSAGKDVMLQAGSLDGLVSQMDDRSTKTLLIRNSLIGAGLGIIMAAIITIVFERRRRKF